MTTTYFLEELNTEALTNILLATSTSATVLGRTDTYSDKRHCRRILILN